jgi:hypothetical protein
VLLWLTAQIAFASVAWYIAARAVFQANLVGSLAGRDLAALVRDLRRAGRGSEVRRLAEALTPAPLEGLLELDADRVSAEDLVASAQSVLDAARPPAKLLRTLATVGTSLGLLAAVATLRVALQGQSAAVMTQVASRAFESAVLGFVTALPCWTAAALCRQRLLQLYRELDGVLLAMRAEGGPDEGPADEGSAVVVPPDVEPVDAEEPNK